MYSFAVQIEAFRCYFKKEGDMLFKLLPAVHDRHNTTLVPTKRQPCRHGHVEVHSRRIAPPPIVWILCPVGWAQICTSNNNRWSTRYAVWWPLTTDFVTATAALPIIKQGSAHCGSIGTESNSIHVWISASSTYIPIMFKICVSNAIHTWFQIFFLTERRGKHDFR